MEVYTVKLAVQTWLDATIWWLALLTHIMHDTLCTCYLGIIQSETQYSELGTNSTLVQKFFNLKEKLYIPNKKY
jgi:hypothetical protein